MSNFPLTEDEHRIASIFFPGQKNREPPMVSRKNLKIYREFLKKKLQKGLLLTGQESVGCFAWEEKFEMGYGSDAEYEALKKQYASYSDQFQLIEIKKVSPGYGIPVIVSRVTDNELFEIPLHDLEVCLPETGSQPEEYTIVEDYGLWIANYGNV